MPRPSVILVPTAAAHHTRLAEALQREGLARAVVRFAPNLEILQPGANGDFVVTRRLPIFHFGGRVLWAIWRRIPTAWRRFVPFLQYGRLADRWIARNLPPSDIFQAVLGACIESCRQAKRLGATVLLDNPFLHVTDFRREVLIDCADSGYPTLDSHRFIGDVELRRWQWQYEICDQILVCSTAAARIFDPYPYASKVRLIHLGVDHRLFAPSLPTARPDTFRVCYTGRIEAPKGAHHLIAAWKQLDLPDVELRLAGRLMPELAWLEKEPPSGRIRLMGILSQEALAACLQQRELAVYPSINEGLSRAMLEAMSCGVPVIACRGTFAEDCVTHGTEGLLVPGRDPTTLADAIRWCYEHRDQLPAMGAAARHRIEQHFTLDHYEQRMLAYYRSLAPGA